MNHIPTTATAAQKLKRLAKTRRKSSNESLAAAQDAVAREHGYHDWKHVTVCLAATSQSTINAGTLPESVCAFLAAQQKRESSPETMRAMKAGLVFAMDIKDADSVRPERSANIHECDDAAPFLAGDIYQSSLRHEREEGLPPARADLEPSEEVQQFIDDIGNYRFFRYSGESNPASVDEAFAGPFRGFFFPPTHVWIAGAFTDMADVRVDSRVVYATSPAGLA